ncbi:MAG: T9SS type A sorting domain-containing protein, partial [Bacteroidales bacterium]|nr:T9SS type A sorting domain-containing protein [Bacteroidales bacterium]
ADYSSPADGKLPARYTPARLIVANDEHSGQIIGHNMFSTEDGFQTFAMDPMPWSINPTVYYCWEHMGVKYLPSGWGCIFGNAFDGYDIAGFYRNLLITRDGGKHWMNITNQDIFDELFRCGNVFDVDGAEDSTFFIAAGQYRNARILRCRGGFPINIGVEAYDDADYTVYPNPTNGKLRIENGELTIEGVEVYDVYGKLLQTVSVNDVAADLDVTRLPAGLYFARIRTDNGVVTKRFVKR